MSIHRVLSYFCVVIYNNIIYCCKSFDRKLDSEFNADHPNIVLLIEK